MRGHRMDGSPGANSGLFCYKPSAQPAISEASPISSSTYERCMDVGLWLPSSRTPTVPLQYLGLGSATTTPERVVVLGLRAIPNSVNRTRSPSWSSRAILISPSAAALQAGGLNPPYCGWSMAPDAAMRLAGL